MYFHNSPQRAKPTSLTPIPTAPTPPPFLEPSSWQVITLGSSTRRNKPHVLICAPSNSALDEIVLRLVNLGAKLTLLSLPRAHSRLLTCRSYVYRAEG